MHKERETMNIKDIFDKYKEHEFLKFDRIKKKKSNRRDLHAFILLDSLFPEKRNIVSIAGHGTLYLKINFKQAQTLTEKSVIELLRCGVRYSYYNCNNSFYMLAIDINIKRVKNHEYQSKN